LIPSVGFHILEGFSIFTSNDDKISVTLVVFWVKGCLAISKINIPRMAFGYFRLRVPTLF